MEENKESTEQKTTTPESAEDKDSFGVSNKKSPWMLFAMLQIPIVIIMIIIVYFMSQQKIN